MQGGKKCFKDVFLLIHITLITVIIARQFNTISTTIASYLQNSTTDLLGNNTDSNRQDTTIHQKIVNVRRRHNDTTPAGWIRPSVIFGHVHMQKTAGTEVNGELALNYERVCGHKGYSYDAYAVNKHVRQSNGYFYGSNYPNDLYSKLHREHSRGRVPMPVMDEIGYENCDVISQEAPYDFWNSLEIADSKNTPIELHLPCRDPIEHLMSQCNARNRQFDCSQDLRKATNNCVWVDTRFTNKLRFKKDENDNSTTTTLKCYNSTNVKGYVKYMSTILQPKRFQSEYVHRSTNTKRQIGKECVWSASQEYRDKLVTFMQTNYDYYGFCSKCMGSVKELPM